MYNETHKTREREIAVKKINLGPSNKFCPQALFLYGTYKEDGTPNFGLFCWFSYCWDTELCVMACVGGEKLTKDRIRQTKVFSANLVSEPLLKLADHLGTTEGYSPGKMDIDISFERGKILNVPVLTESPWTFELEVFNTVALNDSEIYLCGIRNTQAAEELAGDDLSLGEKMRLASPVIWTGSGVGQYFRIDPETIGATGEMKTRNYNIR